MDGGRGWFWWDRTGSAGRGAGKWKHGLFDDMVWRQKTSTSGMSGGGRVCYVVWLFSGGGGGARGGVWGFGLRVWGVGVWGEGEVEGLAVGSFCRVDVFGGGVTCMLTLQRC
jgi:hypothetical protein